MATSEEVLASELNKINKKDLISVLINKKLPVNINATSVISEFINKLSLNCNDNDTSDLVENSTRDLTSVHCSKHECIKIDYQVQAQAREIKLLNQTIVHMEKRLVAQEEIIYLLKQSTLTNNVAPSIGKQPQPLLSQIVKHQPTYSRTQPATSTMVVSNQASSSNNITEKVSSKEPVEVMDSDNSKKISLQEVNKAVNIAMSEVDRQHDTPFKQVTSKRSFKMKNRKPIIGSNTNSTNLAVPKQGYLHVYRLRSDLEAKELLASLKLTAPQIKFYCKLLKKNEDFLILGIFSNSTRKGGL